MRRFAILIVAAVIAGAAWVPGGVVVLKDGTRLEGKIRATRDGFVVTDPSGKETTVAAGDVQSMQPDRPGASTAGAGSGAGGAAAAQGADAAAADIASLRRAVSVLRDPKQAVDKYKAFLARNPSQGSRAEAEKDLAVWQDRVDRGLVKSGEDWLSPAEAAEKQQRAVGTAVAVAPLISSGNYAGAETAIDAALKDAPASPSLLFLKGVILFHKNQLVPARKAFEQVEAVEPDNGAAHNNLAVILWQTRAQIPAMAHYDKAMAAEPGNQKILDNVAEALHQLTPAQAKNEVVHKVVDRFMEQDVLLAAKMKQEKGLMRAGAVWVPADEYTAMQASHREAEQKIAQYQKEARDLPTQIGTMDQDLSIKTNAMKAMVQEASGIDVYGRIQQTPLPQHYYQLKQEVEQLTAERVLKQKRLEQLPRLMTEAQKLLSESQARFTGKQLMVEVPASVARTQPTSRPFTR